MLSAITIIHMQHQHPFRCRDKELRAPEQLSVFLHQLLRQIREIIRAKPAEEEIPLDCGVAVNDPVPWLVQCIGKAENIGYIAIPDVPALEIGIIPKQRRRGDVRPGIIRLHFIDQID